MRVLDAAWRQWVAHNVARGCSKDELAGILRDAGFEPNAVHRELYPILIPNLRRLDSPRAELYVAEDFLDERDCEEIVALIRRDLRPSTISTAGEFDRAFRTSRTCDLSDADPAVERLDRKICGAMHISPAFAEPTQGQYYELAQQFKPHTDYFEAHEIERFTNPTHGQRTWTFMIYLNEPAGGGETAFPNLGLVIKPSRGLAVIWNNLLPDGRPNPDTLHQGMPVSAGAKAIITKWFRAIPAGR
jgi:prolyl 4-hydroxylase